MIIFSADPKEGYLTKEGIREMKSVFARRIYHADRMHIYQQKDIARQELQTQTRKAMVECIAQLKHGAVDNPQLEQLTEELAERLLTVKGRKVYGYLPPRVKAIVDAIVEEIAKDEKDSQNIYLGELDYEALMSCVEGELRYKPLSPYAPVKRDLALVCNETVSCGEIEETIRKASPLVSEVKLFDIYRGANLGEGKKSMAFSLSLSDPKKEVSAEEVERVVKKILGNLKFKLGIEIR